MLKEKLELVKRLFEEALKHVDKGDPVQSSEKLYKVAEECVKALAECYGLEQARKAEATGAWRSRWLWEAVRELAKALGDDVRVCWDVAWTLHVEGFHEARLDIEDVKIRVKDVERLVTITFKGRGLT